MSKFDKLLVRIRNNPQSVPFEDLDKVLTAYGFVCRQPKGGSSHYIYTLGSHRITIPYRRSVLKVVYVKHVLLILDELDAPEDGDED